MGQRELTLVVKEIPQIIQHSVSYIKLLPKLGKVISFEREKKVSKCKLTERRKAGERKIRNESRKEGGMKVGKKGQTKAREGMIKGRMSDERMK